MLANSPLNNKRNTQPYDLEVRPRGKRPIDKNDKKIQVVGSTGSEESQFQNHWMQSSDCRLYSEAHIATIFKAAQRDRHSRSQGESISEGESVVGSAR